MNIDNDLLGIAQTNNKLLNLNTNIFKFIKEDIIRMEEGLTPDSDEIKALFEEYNKLSE